MKTNQQKNLEHAAREAVRPKPKQYDFEPLAAVIAQWVRI